MEGQKEQGNAALKAAEMEIKRAELQLKGEEINLKRGELGIKAQESQLKQADLELRQTELMTTTQLQRDQMAMSERQAFEARQMPQQAVAEKPDRTADAMGRGLEALAMAMSKPKSIVRGPDGRAIGVE
jgi:multidrug resistance efflux pump